MSNVCVPSLGSIHTIWYSWLKLNNSDRSDCILKWYTVLPTSLAALKALWSPSAESTRLVASANPACRQYQPANTDLLDSGYPPSSAYHASSPQPLDPFFDDEDDTPDIALVRHIPTQTLITEYRISLSRGPTPLVCEVLHVRGGPDTGVVVTARVLLSHVGRVVVPVALVAE